MTFIFYICKAKKC